MRTLPALVLVLSTTLTTFTACTDDGAMPDPVTDPPPPTSTVHISAAVAPALVMVRNGPGGHSWQPATMKTPTTFEAEVHGPYLITVVCENTSDIEDDSHHLHSWETWQVGRTPDDPRELVAPCHTPQAHNGIGVHMVQAGQAQLGDAVAGSKDPDWSMVLHPTIGTHDLIATSVERIEVRRGIVIAAGELPQLPVIDVANDGTPLMDVAFSVANRTGDETVQAAVTIATPTTGSDAPIYLGAITAKVAPDSALMATDTQAVALVATQGASTRALQRSFRVGGNTTYTLPAAITDGKWVLDDGGLAATWTALPELDSLVALVDGHTSDPAVFGEHELDLSARFMAATGITRAGVDTDLPGYKPEWKVDFKNAYTRRLRAVRAVNGELATSAITEALAKTVP